MSRGGAQFSAKVQPILQGLENLDGADVPAVLLEGKITDIKPPVLYPARKIRAPLRETKAEHAAIEFSKKIADKFSYSGFFQGVQSGGSIRTLMAILAYFDSLQRYSLSSFQFCRLR